MSPKSRGRKPKNHKGRGGRSPVRAPESPTEALVRAIGRDLRDAETLDAELAVSELLHDLPGKAAEASPFAGPPSGDIIVDLVTDVGDVPTPDALGLLRCIAVLGEDDQRALADGAAQRLVAAGVPAPAWARDLTAVRPVRAWQTRDVFGDQSAVTVEFERAGHRHGLVVLIDHVAGGIAADAFVTVEPDELRAEQRAESDEELELFEDLALEEAQAVLTTAFAPTDVDPLDDVDEEFEATRALALARVRALPPGAPVGTPEPLGEQAVEVLTADFLGSPEAADLRGRPGVDTCASLIVTGSAVRFADDRVGTTPGRLERLVLDLLPESDLDDEEVEAAPDVVAAWGRFAAGRSGLPPAAAAEVVETAEHLGAAVDGAPGDLLGEDVEQLAMSYVGDLLEEDEDIGPEDLAESILRRTFAAPDHATRIGDEEFSDLDPGDPDDRHLLITGEHPEYQDALDDPFLDEVDGVNPRLHIAMHEVIANQLWDDDPPETWQAARRLLAAGMERHDVLHALAEVMTEHIWHALDDQQPPDLEAYQRALTALEPAPARRISRKATPSRRSGRRP